MNNKTIFIIGFLLILVLFLIVILSRRNKKSGEYYNAHFNGLIRHISSIKNDLVSKYSNDPRKKMVWRMRKPIPGSVKTKYTFSEKQYYHDFIPITTRSLEDINDEVLDVPKQISEIFNYLARRYCGKDTTIIDHMSRKFYNDLLGAQLYYFIFKSDLPEDVKKDMISCLGLFELTIIQQNPIDFLEKDNVVAINNFIANEIESGETLITLDQFLNKLYIYFGTIFDVNKLTSIYIENIEYYTGKKSDTEYVNGAKTFVGSLVNMIKLKSESICQYLTDKDVTYNVIKPTQFAFIPPKAIFESTEEGKKLYASYKENPNVLQEEDPKKVVKILTQNTIYNINTDENQIIDFKEDNYTMNYLLEHIIDYVSNVNILNLRFPMLLSDWHKFRAVPIKIIEDNTSEEIKKDKIIYYAILNFAVKTGDLENVKRYQSNDIFLDQRFKALFGITKNYISREEFRELIYNFYKNFKNTDKNNNNLHTNLFNKYLVKSYNQLNKNNLSDIQSKEKIIV
jgi:hypothetical protein